MNFLLRMLVGVVVVAAIAIPYFIWYFRRRGAHIANWAAFAAQTGTLRSATDEFRLYGMQQGLQVLVDTFKTAQEEHTRHTRFAASCLAELPADFALIRRGTWQTIKKVLGGQDISIGDPAFDDSFIVRGSDAAAVQAALSDASLRDTLRSWCETYPSLEVTGGRVVVSVHGLLLEASDLARGLEAVCSCALALDAQVSAANANGPQ